ncbi:hypothetical protein FXO37_07638 [Capsicum annuum]|nr:hypothetical protein FXO37_07638 [Capsicum annuum]
MRTQLKPIEYIHSEPTLKFKMDKREAFAIEEGLHQAIVIKLSLGAPDLKGLRTLLPKHLEIKDHCLIGSLAPWQLLLWCDKYDDYRGWEDGDQRPYEKNQQPGLLASFHPDVEVHNNVAKLVASNVDFQQQQIVANNNAIGDLDARDLMVQFGENSKILVLSPQAKYGLEFEHSISEEHATGDESANKIKGVHSSIVKDWTVVAHKKYLGIQIGSPARVNVQLARNVSYA